MMRQVLQLTELVVLIKGDDGKVYHVHLSPDQAATIAEKVRQMHKGAIKCTNAEWVNVDIKNTLKIE